MAAFLEEDLAGADTAGRRISSEEPVVICEVDGWL